MHLNDEQLLAKSAKSNPHLLQCSSCQHRYQNLTQIRTDINNVTENIMAIANSESSWQALREAHQKHTESSQRSALNLWRYSSFALAASVLLVSVISVTYLSNFNQRIDQQQSALQRLVIENNALQNKISLIVGESQLNQNNLAVVMARVSRQDIALQQAYLLEKTDIEKIKLWQKRKEILNNAFIKKSNRQIKI